MSNSSMNISATDYYTGVFTNPTQGPANPQVWVMPYTNNGSGSQSFNNGAGLTTAAQPTYTNPE